MKEENNNITLSNTQRRAIDIAIKIAQKSRCIHRHGAVLVGRGGTLINMGCNKNEYSSFGTRFLKPEGRYFYATRHAEINSCLNIPRNLTDNGTVFVVRINAQNQLCNSRPCELCQSVMRFCGIRRVVYSTNEGFGEMRL